MCSWRVQHVVDLCQRGDLPSIRVEAHPRMRRSDVKALLEAQSMTEEQRKQLWMHQAMLTHLLTRPEESWGWHGRTSDAAAPCIGRTAERPSTSASGTASSTGGLRDGRNDPWHQPPGARAAPGLPVRRRRPERDRTDPDAAHLPREAHVGGMNRQESARLLNRRHQRGPRGLGHGLAGSPRHLRRGRAFRPRPRRGGRHRPRQENTGNGPSERVAQELPWIHGNGWPS